MGSGLSAEEVARQAGISRTALYRSERGELVKLETLEKLADLLGRVPSPPCWGVGIEYIASAVSYFERLRQIEETAEHITHIAGPISFLLASAGVRADVEPDAAGERAGGFARPRAGAGRYRPHHGGSARAQGDLPGAAAVVRQLDVGVGNRPLPAQWHGGPLRFAGGDPPRTPGRWRGRRLCISPM